MAGRAGPTPEANPVALATTRPGAGPGPTLRRIQLAGAGEPVELAVADWPGPADRPTLLCIPGFTRTSRDFEELARALSGRRRLLCPDLAGRGESGRLADPQGYRMETYLAHLRQLLAALEVEAVSVLGVSMGGLLAMGLAADPALAVRELVLVDIGPSVPRTAFELLDLYLASERSFAGFEPLLAHVRRTFAACALDGELAWRLFALRGARRLPDGTYRMNYDPAIRVPFRLDFAGMEQAWPAYERITARTLVLRGALSHVLPAAVAQAMTERGPRAALVTIAGTGHWPALMKPAEMGIVAEFLQRG
jgi:pimeloyl-ACP methyl ester carboxylesterase